MSSALAAPGPVVFSHPRAPAECASGTTAVEIALVGDVMAHLSQVAAARRDDGTHDFSGQFAAVAPWLAGADLTIANLETVVAGEAQGGFTGYRRFNSPDSLITALAGAGVDVLQTANNHCMDRDAPGLVRTLDVIEAHGLAHAGTHRSAEEKAGAGFARLELPSGLVVAFLAYTYSTNGYWPPDDSPWMVNWTWKRRPIAEDISRARASGAHLVVVGAHTGLEYTHTPEPWFVELADAMVADGADVVMGTHPHVLQPAVTRAPIRGDLARDALILYSLGNFVSAQREPGRDGGVIATLEVTHCADDPRLAWLTGLRFLPVWVDADGADGADRYRVLPVPAEGAPCPADDPALDADDCASMVRHRLHVAEQLGAENTSWALPTAR